MKSEKAVDSNNIPVEVPKRRVRRDAWWFGGEVYFYRFIGKSVQSCGSYSSQADESARTASASVF